MYQCQILVVTLYYGFERCYHWVKLGKGHTRSLCIISYFCMWIYKYLSNFLIYKNGAQVSSMVNSTTHLKKKLYQFSTISPRRLKQKGYFLTHSMRPTSPQYQNQYQWQRKGKLWPIITLTNIDAKNLNKIFVNWLQQCIKRMIYINQVVFISGVQDLFNIKK